MRISLLSLVLAVAAAAPAGAQASGPGSTPPVGNMYTPVFGGTAGIALPVGRVADDHAAGYALGGLIEYGVVGQPYALRGELLYQHFALKSGRTGDDVNLLSLGPTIVFRTLQAPTAVATSTPNTFATVGIAIYAGNAGLGTRPGANAGLGVEIPLSGFSATGEARAHLMLADGRPVITVPLTVSVRF